MIKEPDNITVMTGTIFLKNFMVCNVLQLLKVEELVASSKFSSADFGSVFSLQSHRYEAEKRSLARHISLGQHSFSRSKTKCAFHVHRQPLPLPPSSKYIISIIHSFPWPSWPWNYDAATESNMQTLTYLISLYLSILSLHVLILLCFITSQNSSIC